MVEILTLVIIVILSLLVVRVGAIALLKTGLSAEAAGFQAQSAFMGVGFTTTEAETVVNHPLRRRIVRALMLFGWVATTSTVGTMIITFAQSDEGGMPRTTKLVILGAVLAVLWMGKHIRPMDRLLDKVIAVALERMTHLQIIDFEEMLDLDKGYTIAYVMVDDGGWMRERTLREAGLAEEGVLVLSITRENGHVLGTPASRTKLLPGDRLLCYGLQDDLSRLAGRRSGEEGDHDHELAKRRQRLRLVEERFEDEVVDQEHPEGGEPGASDGDREEPGREEPA